MYIILIFSKITQKHPNMISSNYKIILSEKYHLVDDLMMFTTEKGEIRKYISIILSTKLIEVKRSYLL